MTVLTQNRSRWLLGSGAAALAFSLLVAPEGARAQGIQATPTVTQGAATINRGVPGQDTVTADTATVVIDWQPTEDAAGNALDFLPTGNTVIFENGSVVTDFSVLNRILPATNGNVAVIDGTVISRIFDGAGTPAPGGFVAFYSPTGLLIGNNAVFDVGSLMLTTLDPDPTSFGTFAGGNTQLALTGTAGTTAQIRIDPGATIGASPENSFFVVAAADIQMFGGAFVNGSHVYAVGETVNLTFNNGLFDIQVPVGTTVAQPLTINGAVGGPSSTGAGDDHMIYAVARAQTDPISTLFSGILGFDPAATAGVVNGEIILAANFDVAGRDVAGANVSDGINATFTGANQTSGVEANITVTDFLASSSLLAVSPNRVTVTATQIPSLAAGNLMIAGGETAELVTNGIAIDVLGDLLVTAADFGLVGFLQIPTLADAQGGNAQIIATGGGAVTVAGQALVDASATAGVNQGTQRSGSATGGSARINATDGVITIAGNTAVKAVASALDPVNVGPFTTAGDSTGGLAEVAGLSGAIVQVGGNLDISADAIGADGAQGSTSNGGNALAGRAILRSDISQVSVIGNALLSANAAAGGSNDTAQGALADAGEATVVAGGDGASLAVGGLLMQALAVGGDNAAGQGGDALGGLAQVEIFGNALMTSTGDVRLFAEAQGGNGVGGGDAFGGVAAFLVVDALADLQTLLTLDASANGGAASFGSGGAGGTGTGGASVIEVIAGLVSTSSLQVANAISVTADGIGGVGGLGDGSATTPGVGGDGIGGTGATINQASIEFSNGAYVFVDSDNGNLTVGGDVSMNATGQGAGGGSGGAGQQGANGGIGVGGEAVFGLQVLGGDGTVGQGAISVGRIVIDVIGEGGSGGAGGSATDPLGNGGAGTGGDAFVDIAIGALSAGEVNLLADGIGGDGETGGQASGGQAVLIGDQAQIDLQDTSVLFAGASGGSGVTGGDAIAGNARVNLSQSDLSITVGVGAADLVVGAIASGGNGSAQTGGATGGLSSLTLLDSSLSAESVELNAGAISTPDNATGASANASAGSAQALLDGDSALLVTSVSILASAESGPGGAADGGIVALALGLTGAPQADIGSLVMEADGSGGDTNAAGQFEIRVDAGEAAISDFTGTALGDAVGASLSPSTFDATGGSIRFFNNVSINVLDDFIINAVQGNLVGGPLVLDPSANITITSQGAVQITGDDDTSVNVSALSLAINAREVNIENGARVDAADVVFTSLDTGNAAILGGATEEAGFTFTQDEASRLQADNFTFNGPEIVGNGADDPDILIRDLTLLGSDSGGANSVTINANLISGIVRIEGALNYEGVANSDTLTIRGGDRIEIVTPGGIILNDSGGAVNGTLVLDAENIWAADDALIAQLQADPQFVGRNDDLAIAATGSDDPLGYVRAGTVQLRAGQTLLVRNTGSDIEQGGITVGSGGLTIVPSSAQGTLDAFAYGRRDVLDGTFVTGEAFFDEVSFSFVDGGPPLYTDGSELNDCEILTGQCPVDPVDPTEPPESGGPIDPPITNPTVTIGPVENAPKITTTEGESNRAFGADFPGLMEAPLLSQDPPLEDPVASGGDTTLYGQIGKGTGGDDE